MKIQNFTGILVLAALAAFAPSRAFAAGGGIEPLTRVRAERLFALKVLPLLKTKCFACHGDDPKKIKGKLNMHTRPGLLRGGESELPALIPGEPATSPMYVAITWQDQDLQMPPKENDRLTADQIGQVRRWIAAGAPWPDEQKIKTLLESEWSQERNRDGLLVRTSGGLSDDWTFRRYKPKDVWAYRPLTRPTVPGDTDAHPIDAFVDRKL
ncbi:MAG: hypothetical protein OER86_09130, partial [Phycisphaerae bacterium]|nr:hypothetical protein [Phycisphaerae bacterium]